MAQERLAKVGDFLISCFFWLSFCLVPHLTLFLIFPQIKEEEARGEGREEGADQGEQ